MPNEDEIITPPAEPDYGTGGVYEDPDPQNFPISDLYAAAGLLAETAVFPASFRVGSMPAVPNQGNTPKCVAYSGATLKSHQDYLDQGHIWFNFDESLFFTEIGGTANGALISSGLARLKNYGYPVVTVGEASQHKIASYYSVPITVADIKSAIMNFGALWVIGQMWYEWRYPNSAGVLPAPKTRWSGHATVLYGWDDNLGGFRFRNSWGAAYGDNGDFILPYKYLDGRNGAAGYLWEVFKTSDVIEYSNKRMACGAQIRPDAQFGASLGTIASGTVFGVSGSVAGSQWTKTSACNPTEVNHGAKWYVVRTIAGQSVNTRFPGHSAVYIYAGAVAGG